MQRSMMSGASKFFVVTVLLLSGVGCESFYTEVRREEAVCKQGKLSMTLMDAGGGVLKYELSNFGEKIWFNQKNGTPLSELVVRNGRGTLINYTNLGRSQFFSEADYLMARIFIDRGQSCEWKTNVKDFIRVRRGIYYTDLSIGVVRNEKVETIGFKDFKILIE